MGRAGIQEGSLTEQEYSVKSVGCDWTSGARVRMLSGSVLVEVEMWVSGGAEEGF